MGIDGIGKRPPPAPTAPASESAERGQAAPAERTFTLEPPSTSATAASGATEIERSALDRWKAGEIDLDRYLDLKVDEATRHLASLPAPELQSVRAALRDRLSADPALREMVEAATGRLPDLPPDE